MDISNLDIEQIRVSIECAIVNQIEPDIEFTSMYIFGSFGGKAATKDSDIDILLEVPDATDEAVLEELRNYFEYAMLNKFGQHQYDVVIKKHSDSDSYLERSCELRDYSTVYDVHAEKYVVF